MVVATGDVDGWCGEEKVCDSGRGEVLAVVKELCAWVEVVLVVVIIGVVVVGPVALSVVVTRLVIVVLGIVVPQSTGALDVMLRLSDFVVSAEVDCVGTRGIVEVWAPTELEKVLVDLRDVPVGGSEAWAVVEADVVCED